MIGLVQELDTALLRWSNSWVFWKPWADAGIIFRVEWLPWWTVAGLLAFGALTFLPRWVHLRRRNLEMVAVASASALIARFGIVELVRFFYDRPRPFEVLPNFNQLFPSPLTAFGVPYNEVGAFPSGHAALYFAIATIVARYYPKTSTLFFAAALSLSFARVAAGLHWPSDILGGAAVGIAVGLATHWIFQKYLKPKPAA